LVRFDDRLLEDIKARIPPSRLIGRSVQLQRAGASLKALSPFTKEKTPSFYVNDEKKIFKCFSSGLGGDIFKWLMLTEGLSFPEAVERLAAEAGVALPERDPETAARDQKKRELGDWLEAAQVFFAESLRAGAGKEARDYLTRRGVPAQDWGRFEIGYAPAGWETLTEQLQKKGAKPHELIAAGLAKESDRGKAPYGYFRNRITFAIRDPSGRLVGFGGRALAKDEKAKYINSPESDVFKKGEVLYRYPEARRAASASGREAARRGLVIVEGYMDAIALAQAGAPEAVATLGTAMTPEQIELAWRAGPRPTLLLDGDAAGIAAGYRAAERVLAKLEPGRTMRFARLQGAKDPDDLVRAEGLDGVRRVLDAAESLDAIVWERVAQEHPVSSPDDAAAFEAALKAQINKIEHEGVRTHYRNALLARFNDAYGFRARNRRKGGGSWTKGGWDKGAGAEAGPPLAVTRGRTQAERLAQLREVRRLLHALTERPAILDATAETLAELDIAEPPLAALRDALVAAAERGDAIDKLALERHFAEHGVDMTAALLRDEWTSAAAPALLRGVETDEEALVLWTREAAQQLARRHGRDERADLKTAALEGVEAGDRDVERRFIAGAHDISRPRGEGAHEPGARDADVARARVEDGLDAFGRDVKRLGDRRRSKR
jgi:DNA primase